MGKLVDVSIEVRRLHAKYTNADGTPRRGRLAEGPDRHKRLTSDEFFEIENTLHLAPRIGRLHNNRRKIDELIAVPRGLLNVIMDELGFLIYCEENPEVQEGGDHNVQA